MLAEQIIDVHITFQFYPTSYTGQAATLQIMFSH